MMAMPETLPKTHPEATDLERRVLAHERVLQSLIAYMARTEPRFVDHLTTRFVEPMSMARREHDYRDSDDYAEEFIRAVILLGEPRASGRPALATAKQPPGAPEVQLELDAPADKLAQRGRVQVAERSGIWEVKVDGVFHGDYHQKEHAMAAAALIKLGLK